MPAGELSVEILRFDLTVSHMENRFARIVPLMLW